MNFHSDEWIMNEVQKHYDEAKELVGENNLVGVFLQGSQNYGLDYCFSDVDTKAIVVPSFKDIVLNKKPVSTTHVREDDSHIDLKDIRENLKNLKKQNINFLEILFTKYKVMNPYFEKEFQPMLNNRERIAHYNIFSCLNAIAGMSMEKVHALEHPYPTWEEHIKKYGYSNKQLHHIMRLNDFIKRYINGESFESCLIPSENIIDLLTNVKTNPEYYNLEEARYWSTCYDKDTSERKKYYMDIHEPFVDKAVDDIMNEVIYEVLKKRLKEDILE